jgi:ribosomal protein L29
MTDQERIAQLEEELAALKARLPKHSVPPAMIMELEDLEDELAALRAKVAGEGT